MDNVKKYTHSNFFTNRDNNTLIKEFEGILHHNPHICNLDAVVPIADAVLCFKPLIVSLLASFDFFAVDRIGLACLLQSFFAK